MITDLFAAMRADIGLFVNVVLNQIRGVVLAQAHLDSFFLSAWITLKTYKGFEKSLHWQDKFHCLCHPGFLRHMILNEHRQGYNEKIGQYAA